MAKVMFVEAEDSPLVWVCATLSTYSTQKGPNMPLTGLTILEVDDCEAHNYALSRMLENAGAKVLRAATGSEALLQAAKHPNAILLDINLPDINGFEVCQRLKNDPETASIPVVLITAHHQYEAAHSHAESIGARTILYYPIEQDQLYAVLRGEISRS